MDIYFTGDTSDLTEGIHIIGEELGIKQQKNGFPIHIEQRKGPLEVKSDGASAVIFYEEKIHFFRAFGLFVEKHQEGKEFHLVEDPWFATNGIMMDASRNAVMKVEGIQFLLRKMAIMGLNVMMVYTEDTFTVDKYPYFGYMRGRYSEQELKACDVYARSLGIEMIPCIQTLAHLTEALKWNYAAEIRDTDDILLAGSEKTYNFIDDLIEAASRPFQSKRIHIGMDEALYLGLGNYLDKNGYKQRFSIMNEHLQKVVAIAEKYELKPMIWSDMYFRLGSDTRRYYDLQSNIPPEVIPSIPENLQMVYWDYYHTDQDFYEEFIEKHKKLSPDPVFAGGIWTWNGIAPNYGKTFATTEAALAACKNKGVKEVFATMWGDNGSETPLTAGLAGMQLFAEHGYSQEVSFDRLAERFSFCAGGEAEDFLALNAFDETPGVAEDNLTESNPSKFLLWQDVLIGLYDENIKKLSMNEHYRKLADRLVQAKERNGSWNLLFDYYLQLARVLSVKAEIGIKLKAAYDTRDKQRVGEIKEELVLLRERVDLLRKTHRNLWFSINKPFGWETLDIRYGGLLARLNTACYRLEEWLNGEVAEIEELEEERLYFDGPWIMPEGALGRNVYHRIVTAGALSD